MPGAGKSVVSEVFRNKGWKIVVMSEQLKRRYVKEGLPGESFEKFASRMREKYGRDIVARLCLEEVREEDKLIVMEGVRNWEEVELFKRVGETLILAVHAPPKLRKERLLSRMRDSEESSVEAIERRDRENLKLGIGEVIALADFMLVNDGELDLFKRKTEELVKKILDQGECGDRG
ncbi:hypothetical protein GCM10007116_08950 [Sulfodiicoccus acidiphilus]|uniref:Dephospho-CoA kinase n=3 Tax=Sulfodiicoccus acidiphilus TaxID=1670455 RepID=A0A830GZA6_9CREN|nr:hypothetical protein GCM10007116_08950 [Sulfodiicoccus acidiphilus]